MLKVFTLLLPLLHLTIAFYYSSGLCPKIQTVDYDGYKYVVLLEAYRFIDENTKALNVDQGFCTRYNFWNDDYVVVSTLRYCSKNSVYKNVSLFHLQPKTGGGFSMRKNHNPEKVFGIEGWYPSEEKKFCSDTEYFVLQGNDNVTDTKLIKVDNLEYPNVFVFWGCDQINEKVNKQKLVVLAIQLDVQVAQYVDGVVENLRNSGLLTESAIKYPTEQSSRFCGCSEMLWNEQSSETTLRSSIFVVLGLFGLIAL